MDKRAGICQMTCCLRLDHQKYPFTMVESLCIKACEKSAPMGEFVDALPILCVEVIAVILI